MFKKNSTGMNFSLKTQTNKNNHTLLLSFRNQAVNRNVKNIVRRHKQVYRNISC